MLGSCRFKESIDEASSVTSPVGGRTLSRLAGLLAGWWPRCQLRPDSRAVRVGAHIRPRVAAGLWPDPVRHRRPGPKSAGLSRAAPEHRRVVRLPSGTQALSRGRRGCRDGQHRNWDLRRATELVSEPPASSLSADRARATSSRAMNGTARSRTSVARDSAVTPQANKTPSTPVGSAARWPIPLTRSSVANISAGPATPRGSNQVDSLASFVCSERRPGLDPGETEFLGDLRNRACGPRRISRAEEE